MIPRPRPAGAWPFALALISIAGLSCGYRLAGTGGVSVLPADVEVIVVTPFENRTNRPEIEQRVTEEVSRELSRRGGYRVVTDAAGADAALEGAVTGYRTTPVQFSDEGRATRVEARVTLSATVRGLRDDELLWSQDGLIFTEQFDVADSGEFFDQETVALEVIARGAAEALVTSIVEGF